MTGHDDDILEQGSDRPPVLRWPSALRWPRAGRWPARRAAVLLAAAGLVVGLVAGYAAGDRHGGAHAAPLGSGAAAEALAAGGFPLSQEGPACSAQLGADLQLGLQVTNVSPATVTLRQVRAVLPIGGLAAVARAWGTCGELPQADAPGTDVLPPGASTWFTITFKVLLQCPGPVPVQFTLAYVERGRPVTVHLPGFDDLSQVPYSGCR
jgi:hypothetical protein